MATPEIPTSPSPRVFPAGLLILLMLGLLIRVFDLGNLPPGIFRDEAEKGLTALRIAETGADLNGQSWPIFTKAYGVTTSMIYQYAALPGVSIFGLNEWTTRLPAALVAVATILLNALYLRRAIGVHVALLATAMLAVSPWHVPFSRWAQQGIFLPFCMTVAMYAWHRARTSGYARHWLCITGASLAIAMYAYDVARLFVPAVMCGAVLLRWREMWAARHRLAVGLIAFVLVLSPVIMLLATNTDAAQARFQRISIFGGDRTLAQSLTLAVQNYFAHWSPQFLFISGDPELRHGAGTGVLTLVEGLGLLTFFAIGIAQRWLWRSGWFLALLAFPLAASLTTVGIPHALRCIVALPVIQNAAALGLYLLILKLPHPRRAHAFTVFLIVIPLASVGFLRSYFGDYAARSALNWQYGIKSAIAWMTPHRPLLDRVTYVNFDGADRARTLVEYYRGYDSTRDEFLEFGTPPDIYTTAAPTRQAVITLPGAPVPSGGMIIPIHAPGTRDEVMAIIFNKPAWDAIGPVVTGRAPNPASPAAP